MEQRVADLVSKMTVEEKTGLMIHSSLAGFTGPNGEVLGLPAAGGRGGPGRGAPPAANANRAFQGRANQNNVEPMGSANPTQLVVERNVRYILVRPNAGEPPDITAKFHNGLQEMAEASRLGIPIVFSTDPRHTGGRGGSGKPVISQWPDQLGLAAARDPELVRQFGQIAAKELRAIGIQCLLGPMADTSTEPRWNRISGTFGEDANLNATLIKAIVEGFQGRQLGPESVMTVTKHFPGDGPVKDGYDGHNNYGKWTIYPGNQFDLHLIPFRPRSRPARAAIMGGYFIPVGKDTVGINFSKAMINGLLREKMGFQGLVVTDWLRNMPWGVEKLSEKDRQKMIVLAGVDQIGGDNDPSVILASVKDGGIPMAVIDAAARRILRPMFQLGVFENPYVDPEQRQGDGGEREVPGRRICGAGAVHRVVEERQRRAPGRRRQEDLRGRDRPRDGSAVRYRGGRPQRRRHRHSARGQPRDYLPLRRRLRRAEADAAELLRLPRRHSPPTASRWPTGTRPTGRCWTASARWPRPALRPWWS